jgi:hypothetical protein
MTLPAGRPLDVAGQYYAVLDLLWPANVVCVAELDTAFAADEVDAAWAQVRTANPIVKSRLAQLGIGPPVLVDHPGVACDFRYCEGSLETVLADEQRIRFDVAAGPLVRCRYLVADGSSALLVTGHHAVLDARGGFVLLQQIIGVLASGAVPQPRELPSGLNDRVRPGLRWPKDRRVVLDQLREISERRQGAGPTDVLLPTAADISDRRLSVTKHRLDETATSSLLARAKAIGATGYGMIAAAWLHATHELFADDRATHHLALTTPADLRPRLVPAVPADEPGMYATLIGTSHVVGSALHDELAAEVSAVVQAAVDRGEGELFFALARPGPLDQTGAEMLRGAIAAAPQAIAVSNTGRLPEGTDPEWVRSVWFSFAPSPNQLAFVAATTYRGRLTMAVCTDHVRLPAELGDRLTAGAVERLRTAAQG